MKYDIVPPLDRRTYTRGAQARRAVGIAVEYALIHEKGDPLHPRMLRSYFDMLYAKKEQYVDAVDGFILPRDYGPAMMLRREMDLMARYGRLHTGATDSIGAFMQMIPGLIQTLDPSITDPEYKIEVVRPPTTGNFDQAWTKNSSGRWIAQPLMKLFVKHYPYETWDEIVGAPITAELTYYNGIREEWSSWNKTGVVAYSAIGSGAVHVEKGDTKAFASVRVPGTNAMLGQAFDWKQPGTSLIEP